MAKTIRPILCPQCGSPAKTPLGSDRFRCAACQTEYYLDTDEVTVRHQYPAPLQPPARRYGGAAIFLVVAVAALAWLAVRHFQPGARNTSSTLITKPIFYLTEYVYAAADHQPVYATLRTEGARWGSDSVTLYADFFDPRTGRLRREQELAPLGRYPDNHLYEWHTFPGGRVYLLGNQRLYRVGYQPDRLIDVTDTLLVRFPPASSGVAQVEFATRYEAVQVLTNDGQTFFYLPASGHVVSGGEGLYRAAYANLPRRFFTLDLPENPSQRSDGPLLLANRPTAYPHLALDDFTQSRHFFQPRVLYQDAQALLLDVAATAKPDGPHLVQCLDPATGHLRWSRPANAYGFQQAARTTDGFALFYRTGSELDYVHGALLLAGDGRELRDFQRKRME
ncbi:MAG: hypothetical protein ACRYFK_04465 [Janthinobacterium lividum]